MHSQSTKTFTRFSVVILSVFVLSCGSSNDKDDPPSGRADGGTIGGACGELSEGRAECTGGRNLDVCESGKRVSYQCAEGTVCRADSTASDGVDCFCDNVSDSVCPDDACVDDSDCSGGTLPACDFAQAIYPGTLSSIKARDKDSPEPTGHALSLVGNLNSDPEPDGLSIFVFYEPGKTTGTFQTWDETNPWGVYILRDRSETGMPTRGSLVITSGTLTITSVSGNMTGSLTNAVFVDWASEPTCSAAITNATFDAPITR